MDRRTKQIDAQIEKMIGASVTAKWEEDCKGAVWGTCELSIPAMITKIAKIVAEFRGRVITISPYLHGKGEKKDLNIAYHFDISGVTLTCTVFLKDARRIESITPILKSADWTEREMQEMYEVRVEGHPTTKRLFLEKNIDLEENTLVPLSAAMSGASTSTLWERVISASKGGGKDE